MKRIVGLLIIILMASSCATKQEEAFDPRTAASETGVDVSLLPALGSATSLDKIVTYDQSATEGSRITGVLFPGDSTKFLDGTGIFQLIPLGNSGQWVYTDLSAIEATPFDWIWVSSDSEWQSAYIKCDVAETTVALEFDLYILDGITDITETKLTSDTSELTMSTANPYVNNIDLTSLIDPDEGDFINLRISVIADTATKCTVVVLLSER